MDFSKLIRRTLSMVGLSLARPGPALRLSAELDSPVDLVPDENALARNELSAIFLANKGGDIDKWHHYFEIYDQWFSPFRNRPNLRVLEIGVYKGGSLNMWRQYFGPGAIIVGIDITASCREYENQAENVFVEIGDQTDLAFLSAVVAKHGPFDIIIDDGGHTTRQQIVSFNALYPGLGEGGVYLVEDLRTNYWPTHVDSQQTFMDFAKGLTDRLNEPYRQHRKRAFFRVGRKERLGSVTVSTFCATTRNISFYDSIVAFEKRAKSLPISETR